MSNSSSDRIFLSEEKMNFLANNVKSAIKGLRTQLALKGPESDGTSNAANSIMDLISCIYDSIGQCLDIMEEDWIVIGMLIKGKIDCDRLMGDTIRRKVPQSGAEIVSDILRSDYLNIADVVTEQLIVMGRPLSRSLPTCDVKLSSESIMISSTQVRNAALWRGRITGVITALYDFSDAVNAFTTSDQFIGKLADSFREYIKCGYEPLIDELFDLLYTLRKTVEDYHRAYEDHACGYESGYYIDEEEILRLTAQLCNLRRGIQDKVREANMEVFFTDLGSDSKVRLERYPWPELSSVDLLKKGMAEELDFARDTETRTYSKLKTLADDVTFIYRYSAALKRHSGYNIGRGGHGILKKMSLGFRTEYVLKTEEYLWDTTFCSGGKVISAKRDKLLDFIRKDPEMKDAVEIINNASPDAIDGMIKYYSFYREGHDQSSYMSDLLDSLSLLKTDGEWLAKLYRAGAGENGYFEDGTNYVNSANSNPERIRALAIKFCEEIAKDDSHGYDIYYSNRWGGTNYDCTSLAVSAYINAGVPGLSSEINWVTTNMDEHGMDSYGFRCFSAYGLTSDDLLPGDIIMITGSAHDHAVIYIGDGKGIEATFWNADDSDETGDNGGLSYDQNPNQPLTERLLDAQERYGLYLEEGNYTDEDTGLPWVGEISLTRVTPVDSNELVPTWRGHWNNVLRYTAGMPVS